MPWSIGVFLGCTCIGGKERSSKGTHGSVSSNYILKEYSVLSQCDIHVLRFKSSPDPAIVAASPRSRRVLQTGKAPALRSRSFSVALSSKDRGASPRRGFAGLAGHALARLHRV